MALEYGISSKGKPTVLYRNFEYIKDKENVCGTIAWRCRYHQSMKCKARLTTSGDRVVSSRDPGHNHDRVQRTVSAYGQSEVLLYLRAISHLSHV